MSRVCLFLFLLSSLTGVAQPVEVKFTVYDSAATTGYYFICNPDRALITDKFGEIIYEHPCTASTPVYNLTLQPNGLVTYSDLKKHYIADSTFKAIDSIANAGKYKVDKHDLLILPNGHLLLMGMDSLPLKTKQLPQDSKRITKTFWVTAIEYDTNKKVVFEWRAKDYVKQEDADTFFLTGNPLVSWTHANSIDLDHDGNILMSLRNYNQILKINRTTGEIMWRLGGNNSSLKFINCPVPFYGQHDARSIGNNRLTLFDNGNNNVPHGARALEFELDEKKKTATLVWSHTVDSAKYSTRSGNVQRLKNGNTLINTGQPSRNTDDHISFVVVKPDGKKILEATGVRSYRVLNYETLPWQFPRPAISCFDSLNTIYLNAGAGYSSYRWNTGDSTQTIAVKEPGVYSVFVPFGEGGYISSEKISAATLGNGCAAIKRE